MTMIFLTSETQLRIITVPLFALLMRKVSFTRLFGLRQHQKLSIIFEIFLLLGALGFLQFFRGSKSKILSKWPPENLRKIKFQKLPHNVFVTPQKSPPSRVDYDFLQGPRHNSTVKIVDCDIFQHIRR